MIEHKHAVAGEPVAINVMETTDDVDQLDRFLAVHGGDLLGLDSETTGLDIYSEGFRIRVLQVGTARESFVLPMDSGLFRGQALKVLDRGQRFVLHNASYDLQVFERTLGVKMEFMWQKVIDTRILSHLVDPRGKEEGGLGHSLEELTRYYLDAEVADNVKGLMKVLCQEHKTTTANVWKKVPFDDPSYQLYSGMDPILAVRLWEKLRPLVPSVSQEKGLAAYEHQLAAVCAYMERTGFHLDVDYSEQLSDELKLDESKAAQIAFNHGCDMVNSTDSVADALERFGITITGRTPSGKRKVDDAFLQLVIDAGGQAGELAKAVIAAKKAGKWRKTWVQAFLDQRDAGDRCHASINPLRARTARMSITGIPAQTLPAGDHTIRRCFLADEGEVMASVDYQAQELRVMAALSGDRTMIDAFLRGDDLHLLTAQAAWGPAITKDSPERKYAKVANFGKAYGGGPKAISEQTGLDFFKAKHLSDAFDAAYPEVASYSLKLQAEATKTGSVITPTGRRLPVDQSRAYSALNYVIQSTSRDVTGRALLRLHDAGFTPNLRLPIHDEVLCSVPEDKARWGANKIGEIMQEQMGPLLIGTDAEVGGRSWGSLYGSEY